MEIVYLTLENVLTIHEDQIIRYGGSSGIGRFPLLESAIFRPQSTFGGDDLYPTIFDKAASFMHSLILNHPFIDGNKRTGTASMLVFLELNNYRLKISQEQLVNMALSVESKKTNVEQLSLWLKKNSKKI